MKSKFVTICFSKRHLLGGLLNNVSTQGNWIETVPNHHTPEQIFRGGPVSKQSLIEGLRWFALANASKTIRILVLCAASLMTAFLGDNILFPLESHRSLSPQYLVSVGSGLFVIPI